MVLRAVGLRGDGESGVRGMVMAAGDGIVRVGRDAAVVAAEMLRESLGLATRVASMAAHKVFVSMIIHERTVDNFRCSNKRI